MSIYSVAVSGLNAFQRAMSVISHNIDNVHTRGYTRQSTQFTPIMGQKYAGSYVGAGVNVSSIYRNTDEFANYQVRSTTSTLSQYDTFYQQASQIDKLMSQEGTSVSGGLRNFFESLGQLNNEPDSVSARGVALKQAQVLVGQFNTLQKRLDEYQQNSTKQIGEAINQINQITANIADVNTQLMSQPTSPGLLDARDDLLNQLAKFVDVTALDQGDGTISVSIANGEMLVAGSVQRTLSVNAGASRDQGTQVFLGTGAGSIDISKKLTTGMLGGLKEYEKSVIEHTSQLIGQMAIGLAQQFNAQHQLGMDMNNQIGKQFFTDYNSTDMQLARSISATGNAGTGTLSVNISDIAQTKLSEYDLVVTDASLGQVRLIRKSDGSATNLNWSSGPPAPPAGQLVVDGMTITVDDVNNLVTNDSFNLVPTRGAARDLSLQINDVKEIAMASPVKTQASLNNTGNGRIALGQVINTAAVNKQFRVEFISDTQYNLVNVTDSTISGPLAFIPNTENTIQIPDGLNPSYSITLSGIPKTGDQFTADYNAGGVGDNRNGLSLSGIQQSKMFSGGAENLFDSYSNLLANIGSQTNQAKLRLDSSKILYDSAVDFQQSKSGVDLNEEAGNMLKFEQAFKAAGKLMEVSSQMMNVLFDMMR